MVIIFTRTTCAPCKTVKYFLTKKGVEFTEKNIDEPEHAKEFAEYTDLTMVPLVLTPSGDKIQGLNLALLTQALKLA